jgi:hypothetical protein
MKRTCYGFIALFLLLCSATAAPAQVSIGVGLPNVSIGINLPLYPELVPIPGYPVYYAPSVAANYFFYDGMYWAFYNDSWYASSWYNGPWSLVAPVVVPVFILRVPVRYYVRPPVYFHGWRPDAPPHWGRHWGPKWEQRRRGWDRWNRAHVPSRAPLPVYQRQYSGDRYPRFEQQQSLHRQHYRHQPRNARVRSIYQQQMGQRTPATDQRRRVQQPPARGPQQRDIRRSEPSRQATPAGPRPQTQPRGGKDFQRPAPPQAAPQQRGPTYKGQGRQPGGIQGGQRAPRQQDAGRPQGPAKGGGHGEQRGGGREHGR